MGLVVDFDRLEPDKKAWLLDTLKLMEIGYEMAESRQTREQYNLELEARDMEIERGEFTTAEELKIKMKNW